MKNFFAILSLGVVVAMSACKRTENVDTRPTLPSRVPSTAVEGQETNNSQSATGPSGSSASPDGSLSPTPGGQRPIPSQGSPGPSTNP